MTIVVAGIDVSKKSLNIYLNGKDDTWSTLRSRHLHPAAARISSISSGLPRTVLVAAGSARGSSSILVGKCSLSGAGHLPIPSAASGTVSTFKAT